MTFTETECTMYTNFLPAKRTGLVPEGRLNPVSNGTWFHRWPVFLLFIATLFPVNVQGQGSDNLDLSGYVEALPIYMEMQLPGDSGREGFFEYRMQNRLNLEWFLTSEVTLNGQLRTRFFTGDLVRQIPGYADLIDSDNGIADLSGLILRRDNWFVHTIPDRLYGEWVNSDWSIRVGRQRVNWGVNTVTNPNDLFNIYSFYDFSYPERPGSDAVRIQRFLGFASRMELTVSPARTLRESVAAFLYSFNQNGYDVQLIGGYYRNRLVVGGGWAGSIRQTGFKGEVSWFFDLEDWARERNSSIVAVISADHMFENRLFLVVETLYNQEGGRENFSLIGQPLSADNPSFSQIQFTANASYPISLLLNASLALIAYPDEKALFVSPQVSLSVTNNIDFQIISQLFAGSGESPFADSGFVLAGSLKWNY